MTEVRLRKRTITVAAIMFVLIGAAACTREKPPASEPTPPFYSQDITPSAGTGVAWATVESTFTPLTEVPPESTESALGPTSVTGTPAAPTGSTTYTVQWGDWLSKVAQQHGVTAQALIAANPGLDANHIYPGQVLVIPAAGAPDATPSSPIFSTPTIPTPASAATPAATPSGMSTYTVQKGEWFVTVARKFGLTVQELQTANPNVNPEQVQAGQVLNIPGGKQTTPRSPASGGSGASYTVRQGDTLYSIAARFGKSPYDIQIANHLASPNSIYAGQTLIIP